MLNLQLAHRYSKAFFLVAKEMGKIEDFGKELKLLVKELDETPVLKKYFSSPIIPTSAKKEMAAKCFDGEISVPTMNFFHILIDKQREPLIEEIAREYEDFANKDEGIIVADVTTARALKGDQGDKLSARIHELTGKKVKIRPHLNPEMIGGVVLQIGDRRIDGSLTTQLEELRNELLRA